MKWHIKAVTLEETPDAEVLVKLELSDGTMEWWLIDEDGDGISVIGLSAPVIFPVEYRGGN